MSGAIHLVVYRRLDEHADPTGRPQTRAYELHALRREALRRALQDQPGWRVRDWGGADNLRASEWVEVVLDVNPAAAPETPGDSPYDLVARTLHSLEFPPPVVSAASCVVERLRREQKSDRILSFRLNLVGGTAVQCDSSPNEAVITICPIRGDVTRIPLRD